MPGRTKGLQLELISSVPQGGAHDTPLLFVHGAFAAAWCWAEHFLAYFASRGYAAHALSLRGHGASEGHERLLWTSLRDYVEDVEQTIAELGVAPVIVGHSMGGMVVQKYLERAAVPAAVLMASVPPQGLLCPSLWLALRDPLLFHELGLIQLGGACFATAEGARRAIFSHHMPAELVAKHYNRLQQESQRAVLDMTWYDLPRPERGVRPPTLVLGAERDALLPPALVESTARVFDTRAEIFPGMAHAMMLEPDWRMVAERILVWLESLGL